MYILYTTSFLNKNVSESIYGINMAIEPNIANTYSFVGSIFIKTAKHASRIDKASLETIALNGNPVPIYLCTKYWADVKTANSEQHHTMADPTLANPFTIVRFNKRATDAPIIALIRIALSFLRGFRV